MKKIVLIFSFLMLSGFSYLSDSEKQNLSNKAIQSYNQKDYKKSAEYYQKIVNSGIENPKLYYNLGEIYYKLGEKSKSKFYFIKAKELAPRNPKIDDKLDPEYSNNTSILSNIFLWNNYLNTKESLNISLILWIILCLTIIVNNYMKINKENYKLVFNSLLALNVIFLTSTLVKIIDSSNKIGVIASEKVEVKSSNDSSGINLFELKNGEIIRIIKVDGDYAQILSEDRKGWVKLTSILL